MAETDLLRRCLAVKEQAEERQRQVDKAAGALGQLNKQLKEEFQVSAKVGPALLAKIVKEEEKLEAELTEQLVEFEQEFRT
jgi:hypothetical protein